MLHTSKPSAIIATTLLHNHAVSEIVVSPGSRCAPLIEAIAKNEAFKIHTIIDERTAAFYALGLSQMGKRVALICTSGTAMLNYAPAIAEAYYQGLPLIALTADRPLQWIDQDDSQTIRQFEGLDKYVKASFDIPDFNSTDKELSRYAMRIINEAIGIAFESKQGPVHINMQFNAPLTLNSTASQLQPTLINTISGPSSIAKDIYLDLANKLQGKKVLVVAGFMQPNHRLSRQVKRFCQLPNVALLAEKLSNLKTDWPMGIDRVLRCVKTKDANPDIVITIGGALVSRHVKEWLRGLDNIQHWSIGEGNTFADCFGKMTLRIKTSPTLFFNSLTNSVVKLNKTNPLSTVYNHLWHNLWEIEKNYSPAPSLPFCDLKALNWIYNQSNLPKDYNIQLSNGTSVRYAELLASDNQHALYCNRGTSGIEGATATALGAAYSYGKGTLLITGDMSFRHNIGALMLPNKGQLKILVVNNNGGDIFRFISTTSNLPEREDFYTCKSLMTPTIKNLAEAFGYCYLKASSMEELKSRWPIFMKENDKVIMELNTSHCDNAGNLKNYFTI